MYCVHALKPPTTSLTSSAGSTFRSASAAICESLPRRQRTKTLVVLEVGTWDAGSASSSGNGISGIPQESVSFPDKKIQYYFATLVGDKCRIRSWDARQLTGSVPGTPFLVSNP